MRTFLFITALFFAQLSIAQDFITIEPAEYEGFIQTETAAFKVEVNRVQRKAFMDHWEDYLEDVSDNDIMRTDNTIKVDKVVMKKIRKAPVNVYMHFEDITDGTRVYIGFQDSVSGFIAMSNQKYGMALTDLIRRETKKVFVETKKVDMKAEEKHLAELEKNLSKVKKEEDKLNKKIISKRRDIDDLKNEIEINKGVVAQLRDEIGTKRTELSTMAANASEEVIDQAKDDLKKKEKEASKASSTIEKDSKKIYDYEADIRDYEYALEKLKQDETYAQDKVTTQREVVKALKDELYKLGK